MRGLRNLCTPRGSAVIRKVGARWRFAEFERPSKSARYTLLAQGQLRVDCHSEAKSNDDVFTKS